MKPVFQTKFGGSEAPEDEQGNCLQAAIASVFEIALDEAPDFAGHIVDGSWFSILQDWLSERNLVIIPVDIGNGWPFGIHIMCCESTTLDNPDDGHVVVIKDGEVIHDPNPNAKELGERQQYWCFGVLDPSRQHHV